MEVADLCHTNSFSGTLHSSALYYHVLHGIYTALHYTKVQCIALHYTAL